MENNKPLSAEEQAQKIDQMIEDLTTRAEAGDMMAMLALSLLGTAAQQDAWTKAFVPRGRKEDMEMLGLVQPSVKIDTSAPAIAPSFELTALGKYFGNEEKGVLVQVIPDEPTRFIHEAPRGLQ
jgi:hypothetical protein